MLKRQEKGVVSMIKTKKSESSSGGSVWSTILKNLQEFGKSLQYPVAILPFCAILLRLGNLGESFCTTDGAVTNQIGYWVSHVFTMPGSVAFDNMALFFGVGVAFGLAKDHRGEAALVGALFYMALNLMLSEGGLATLLYQHVLTKNVLNVSQSMDSKGVVSSVTDGTTAAKSQLLYVISQLKGQNILNVITGKVVTTYNTSSAYVLSVGVLGGVTSGALTAFLYNRFKNISLPKALSFFGGRRFVPMIAVVVVIPTAFIFAAIWPWFQFILMEFGKLIKPENPAVAIPGIGLYSFLNRLLLPFGLHQVLNTFFWFQLPESGNIVSPISGAVDSATTYIQGDINAFNKGLSGSGLFQSGFFPIMMGGMPAAAAAMIMAAPKERRKEVSGFLGGVAGVAFLCGITEPIEFSFVFIAPALYGIHACLTAAFNMIVVAMRIQLGFSFSAGFIDFAVSIPQSWGFSASQTGIYKILSNPLMILPVCAAAAAAYYFVFYFWIKKFDVKTPGRDELIESNETQINDSGKKITVKEKYATMAQKLLDIVGPENVETVDNCATRLRLQVKDSGSIDEAKIKATGVFGMKKLGKNSVQIIVGPDVEHVANAFADFWNQQKVSK